MKETELKPCPFCGSRANIDKHISKGLFNTEQFYNASCYLSGARTRLVLTEEDAKELWNRRAGND